MAEDRIVAVGLLTQREVELLGHGFSRLWPIEETRGFDDLLKAIDEADGELKLARNRRTEPALEVQEPNPQSISGTHGD